MGQRARVRGVQGAQQQRVGPRLGDRRRLVPEHVLRALHERRHDDAGAALAGRPDLDQHRQRDQPQRAHQPEGRHVRHGLDGRRHAGQHGALRLLHARRAAGAERRVRRHVAQPLPLDAERPARAGRLHGRRRQPDAAGGARRLLRQRAEQQPEHPAPAGPERPVDDDHAAHVQPERELRAGRPAGVRRRRQLREGGLRLRQRPRARVPARGEQRRGRLRRLREHLDAADDGRHADHVRRHDAAGVLPVRGRRVDARTASRPRCRACRTRRSASTPTTATRP